MCRTLSSIHQKIGISTIRDRDHLCCRARNLNKSANHVSAKRYYDVLLNISVILAFSARYLEFEFGPRPGISPLDGVAWPFDAAATAKNTRPGSMPGVTSCLVVRCDLCSLRCGRFRHYFWTVVALMVNGAVVVGGERGQCWCRPIRCRAARSNHRQPARPQQLTPPCETI